LIRRAFLIALVCLSSCGEPAFAADDLDRIRTKPALGTLNQSCLVPVQCSGEPSARQGGFDAFTRQVLQGAPELRRARIGDYLLPTTPYDSDDESGVDIGTEEQMFRDIWAARIHGTAEGADSCTACDTATNADFATLAGTLSVVDAASDTTTFCAFWGSATGSLPGLTDSGCAYDASSNTLTLTGSGTGLMTLGPWASNNAWYALGMSGSLAAGSYTLRSGPADTHVYLNAPSSREIRFRINDVSQFVVEAGSLVPASAGSGSLGRAGLGYSAVHVDSSSSSASAAIVGGAFGSNITLTLPATTGTLALTSDLVTDHGALSGLADDDHTQYHNDSRALTWLGTRSTTDLPEGSGLYFTDERAQDAIGSMVDGTLVYTDGTPLLGVDPTLSITSLTLSSLTAGRVPIVSTAGLLADDAGLLYDATTDQLTSGIFKQGANNAGGFYGTPSAGSTDNRIFLNASNDWEVRRGVGGIAPGTYVFSGAAFYPTAGEDLGLTGTRWGAGYFSGLVRASSLNLTLGGTELALATDEVAMFTSRAAGTNNAYVGINSGGSGNAGLRFYDDGALTSTILSSNAGGTTGLTIATDTTAGSASIVLLDGASGFFRYRDQSGNALIEADHATSATTLRGNLILTGTSSRGFIELGEYATTTDAAAPSADRARLYVRDNGAGKEQLVVRFATGAVQVLATEP
jgi:hypothetical protein